MRALPTPYYSPAAAEVVEGNLRRALELTVPAIYHGNDGDSLNYRIYKPQSLEASKRLPLLLFLHGAGERGDDNQAQVRHGIASLINYGIAANDPAILLVPQCPAAEKWIEIPWNEPDYPAPAAPSRPLRLALSLFKECVAALEADRARLYISGISMGGFGTWDALRHEPQHFAAALPICGGGYPAFAAAMRHIPIHTIHGDADNAVNVGRSRAMVEALRQLDGVITYREIAGGLHDVWSGAYNDSTLLDWLFAQRKAV